MDGYEADIAGLRKAAGAASSAGEQAKQIHLGDGPHGVPAGMPGSQSATKADPLAQAWQDRLSTWAADIGQFGTDVAGAADDYERNDAAAERDFSLLGWIFK
jgi:hypothetical protein